MIKRILLSLFPILALLNAGCSRSSSQRLGSQGQQTTLELLELKLKCAEVGQHFDAARRRDFPDANLTMLLPGRFAYNAKLNTCVYRGGSKSPPTGLSSYFIVDLATNQELASYTMDSSDPEASRAEKKMFDQRELELFGPNPD